MKIGILDFDKMDINLLPTEQSGLKMIKIKTPGELDRVQGLIISGEDNEGFEEATKKNDMIRKIQERASRGLPVLGICAGLVLIAQEIQDCSQPYIELLAVHIKRKSYGAGSGLNANLVIPALGSNPVKVSFRYAPVITKVEPKVGILCMYEGKIVMVRQGNYLGTTFIPEATDESLIYRYFNNMVKDFYS